MTRKRKISALTVGVIVAASIVGLGAGTAVAVGPVLLSPDGVSADKGVATAPMPEPDYAENAQGLSYGSAAEAPAPDVEPDLVLAVATNGTTGYVKKADLDDANGTTAAESFNSPADALAWQEAQAEAPDTTIPVYKSDGKTEVGSFLVESPDVD